MPSDYNPYVYGPPVKGEHFYGRANEISFVLNTNIKQILFVAVRRAGKTSLLHQLSFLSSVVNSDDKKANLSIYWNLEGVRDARGARERFNTYPIRKMLTDIKWDNLERYKSCSDTLWKICEIYDSQTLEKNILLLIDEPDLFNHLSVIQDNTFLYEMKDCFSRIPNLRVIMVSPPRIIQNSEESETNFIENFQRLYLSGLRRSEAKRLINLENMEARPDIPFLIQDDTLSCHLMDDILEMSNHLPFYIQQICGDIFGDWNKRNPSEIIEEIIESNKFSDFYVSDFRELHAVEKLMVLIISQSKEPMPYNKIIEKVIQKAGEKIAGKYPTKKFVNNLVNLGVFKKFGGAYYHFSNILFDGWVTGDFRNLWEQAMKEAKINNKFHGTLRPERIMKAQDFQKLRAEIDAISHTIQGLTQDMKNGNITPEYYYNKQLSLIRDRVLLFLKLKRHLDALGAHELANLLELYSQKASSDEISDSLKKVQTEAKTNGWIDFFNSEFQPYEQYDVRPVLAIAYRVADQFFH